MIASDQFQIASGAKWTPDGKKLLLIGGVGLQSIASQGFRGTPNQLFSISLTKIDKAPASPDINTEEQALAALNEPAAGRGGRGGAAASAERPGGDRVGRHGSPHQEAHQHDRVRGQRGPARRTAAPTLSWPWGAVRPAPMTNAAAAGRPSTSSERTARGMTRLNTTITSDGAGRGRGGRGGGRRIRRRQRAAVDPRQPQHLFHGGRRHLLHVRPGGSGGR